MSCSSDDDSVTRSLECLDTQEASTLIKHEKCGYLNLVNNQIRSIQRNQSGRNGNMADSNVHSSSSRNQSSGKGGPGGEGQEGSESSSKLQRLSHLFFLLFLAFLLMAGGAYITNQFCDIFPRQCGCFSSKKTRYVPF